MNENLEIANQQLDETAINNQSVLRFLSNHPDFFNNHPVLWEIMIPPTQEIVTESENKVLDFQSTYIKKLQEKTEKNSGQYLELAENIQDLLQVSQEIMLVMIALIGVDSLDQFCDLVEGDWPEKLNLSEIRYWVEANKNPQESEIAPRNMERNTIEKGKISHIVAGDYQNIILGKPKLAHNWIFEKTIASQALVKLRLIQDGDEKIAMVAFGSCDSDHFHSENGTDYLKNLQLAMEKALTRISLW